MTRRLFRRAGFAVIVLAVILIGARLALPSLVKRGVNRALAKNEQVTGRIGDVDIAFWRGAYQIHGVQLKDAGRADAPSFMTAKTVDFSVDMRELVRHRRLLAKGRLFEPVVNTAAFPKKNAREAKQGAGEVKRAVVPVDVSRIEVTSGTLVVPSPVAGGDPVTVDRVFLVGENLFKTGVDRGGAADDTARLKGTAHLPGNGFLDVDLAFDPAAKPPSFDVKVKLEKLDLAALNPLIKPAAGIDLQEGTGNLYAEIRARDGRFDGYVKPILQGVKIHGKGEKDDSLGEKVKETVAEAVKNLVKNDKNDSVATRVPLSGRLDDPTWSVWTAIAMTLRNGFIRAIRPGLENKP